MTRNKLFRRVSRFSLGFCQSVRYNESRNMMKGAITMARGEALKD